MSTRPTDLADVLVLLPGGRQRFLGGLATPSGWLPAPAAHNQPVAARALCAPPPETRWIDPHRCAIGPTAETARKAACPGTGPRQAVIRAPWPIAEIRVEKNS